MKRRTRLRRPIKLNVERFEQPDDVTCGPTCLAKVYRYYGLEASLADIIEETPRNPDGGTLAVNLAISAIREGFRPTMYPFGLRVFDPTWRRLDGRTLARKLRRRRDAVRSVRLRRALAAYTDFLTLGGRIRFQEPSADLLVEILRGGDPILTGLSATHLYRTPRERHNRYDDVRGESVGHFVVVSGYDPRTDRFVVTDPFRNVPLSRTGRYTVPAERLMTAILLGESTYDAVLLVVGPR
ncbi:MAG: hypothetical protein JSW43_08030 [Gemmatimonadota bacterium]|nr:MAG: hypothetical protein JSW43_08030 [Gemmatimonadota bacterium]